MENILKPQPLMAEVLPGFTTMFILSYAYCAGSPGKFTALMSNKSSAAIIGTLIGGGFVVILISWVIGTFLDSLRDLIEHFLDRFYPVNWGYLLVEPSERIQKLNDSWLAYYFLNGNMAIGLILGIAGLKIFGLHLSHIAWIVILVATAVYGLNFWTSRNEIRALIGCGLPHENVYTRLGRSTIAPTGQYSGELDAGVGVFAIRAIPQGTLVFAPDDDKTIHISANEISTLPLDLRKLYKDFCPLKEGAYECPLSFNQLTVGWYLNHSDTPNCEADQDLRFRALRDIHAGEELCSRYSDYSE